MIFLNKSKKNDNEVNIKDPNDFESRDKGIQNQIKFMSWIQEFTKKIVTITFIIFIISNAFYLFMIFAEFSTSESITYIDTFIAEMHLTFRDVIGGYIVKAAAENVIKIGGGYLIRYTEAKAQVDMERLRLQYADIPKNPPTNIKHDDFDSDLFDKSSEDLGTDSDNSESNEDDVVAIAE